MIEFFFKFVSRLALHIGLTWLFTGMSELILDSVLSTEARSFVEMVCFYLSLFLSACNNVNLHIECVAQAATKIWRRSVSCNFLRRDIIL